VEAAVVEAAVVGAAEHCIGKRPPETFRGPFFIPPVQG
jgi:hypothetical protein